MTEKGTGKVDRRGVTQVGRALCELGIEAIPAYSAQARGRSERNFGTWQGRLPQELRVARITTLEAANRFLRERYIWEFNRKFSVAAARTGSAFVKTARRDLEWIFSLQHKRKVNRDNRVVVENQVYQIERTRWRDTLAGCTVVVHELLDGTIAIRYGPHLVGRYDRQGPALTSAGRAAQMPEAARPIQPPLTFRNVPRRPRVLWRRRETRALIRARRAALDCSGPSPTHPVDRWRGRSVESPPIRRSRWSRDDGSQTKTTAKDSTAQATKEPEDRICLTWPVFRDIMFRDIIDQTTLCRADRLTAEIVGMNESSKGEASAKSTGGVGRRISKPNMHLETVSVLARMVAAAEAGSRLPTERELCEQLGVGRSTLREAMRSLAFIGAIRIRHGSGTYVSRVGDAKVERLVSLALMLQRTKVHEAIEARQILETQAVRMAAHHHDESDHEELISIMRNMARSVSSPLEASRYDLQFHVRLASASHNSVLMHFINGMRALFEIWINRAVNCRAVIEEVVSEHNSILDAVFARNAELAAARMTVHLTNAAERLLLVAGRDQSTADFISLLLEPGIGEQEDDRRRLAAEAAG